MAIVNTTEEIKKYITVDGSFDFNTVLPYIELAENEVKRVLGKDQYNELDDYYNGINNGIYELDELLPFAQRPVVYFAFLKGLDKFNVSIGNNGIGVISNTQLAPASKERVENLRTNIKDSGWDAIEYLLQFLEENKNDYPAWESSEAFAETYKYLITSANQFDNYYKIKRSRLNFLQWKQTMADVELLQLTPVISVEMLNELKKQQRDNNISEKNKIILPYLQKALAYLTAAEKGDLSVKNTGEHYLMLTKKILDKDPDDYPTYKASSVYLEESRMYTTYENDQNSGLAIF